MIWQKHRIAILSTEPSRAVFNPFTAKGNHRAADNGKLQLYDLDTGAVEDLVIKDWPKDRAFHPLGINLLETPGTANEAILGVANCPEGPCSIEMLRLQYDKETLRLKVQYVRSLEHPGITSPNAVVVLSENEVLFTNSFGVSPRTSKLLHTIEQSLSLPGGSGKLLTNSEGKITCKSLISKIPLANGLALSSDRKVLAVASTMGQYVSIYGVDDAAGGIMSSQHLKHRKDVPVGFLVDNLHFVERRHDEDPFGDASERVETDYTLLCAGHPSALEFLATAAKPLDESKAPSRVVKISVPHSVKGPPGIGSAARELFTKRGKEVETLFESKGDFFATSSTATAFETKEGKQAMLVCGLWEKGLLVCEDVAI